MRKILFGVAFAASLLVCPARAEDCPGNPDAIGTSRTIAVDPAETPWIGTMSYPATLKLQPKEVVITLDDGPLMPMSEKVLEILRSECVKVTYFLVGRNAKQYPEFVRKLAAEGHTIGTHSQNHPLNFQYIAFDRGVSEINEGIRSVTEALEPAGVKPLPWFRFPGFNHTAALDNYLKSQHMLTVGADYPADDWFPTLREHPDAVLARAMSRIEAKGSGILLLHDIQPVTVLVLPRLLKELKAKGYHIVQMVPAPEKPAEPAAQVATAPEKTPSPTPSTQASVPVTPVAIRHAIGQRRVAQAQASVQMPRLMWPKFFKQQQQIQQHAFQ